MEGYYEKVELLLAKGADVNAPGQSGCTPLINCTRFKNIVQILIANGANVNAKKDNGSTPLHIAAFSGHTEGASI